MLLLSQALLWCVVIILAISVLALARQIGVLHERIAPVGALALSQGPQPGEVAPRLVAETLGGTTAVIGGARLDGRPQLLFFVAPSCPICKLLLPTARLVAETEQADLLLVGDGDHRQHRDMAERHGIALADFVNSAEVGQIYRVGKLPYAVLIDQDGTIIAQGLVNNREHLESLFAVKESGHRTVQDFLKARRDEARMVEGIENHG
jgi:methylamine dehydrogenase accessory protein MauD